MTALGTRLLTLSIGGDDVTAQISKAEIHVGPADSDFTSFADAAGGGSNEWRLEFTAVQDMAADSIWDLIWSATGTTVAYLLKPYGNTAASVGEPHLSGNLTIKFPEGKFIGGEANASTSAKMTFDGVFVLDAKPTKVTV